MTMIHKKNGEKRSIKKVILMDENDSANLPEPSMGFRSFKTTARSSSNNNENKYD